MAAFAAYRMDRILESLPGLLILLAEGLAVALLAMIGHTIWTLTHPPRRTFASAIAAGRPTDPAKLDGVESFETWAVRTRGMDLPVWDVPGRNQAGPIIVLTHGWGDSRLGSLVRIPGLLDRASRLIAWDMPGHGDAPGRSTLGHREPDDLVALLERLGSDRPLVLYGWSMGAGVSIAAAAMLAGRAGSPRVIGVIAEGAYRFADSPPRNVLRLRGLPYRLNLPAAMWCIGIDAGIGPAWRGYDRAPMAAALACPLLFIHGELDEVTPIAAAKEIAASAKDSRVEMIRGAGHVGLWSDPALRARAEAAIEWLLPSRG